MFSLKGTYNKLFLSFSVFIICLFFIFRPLNSPWFRIITADGLGYYSYLPAKFIYHDDKLDFKWFNEVYPKYYNYNSFAVPTENFMTEFKGKYINKYFPGLSFLYLPFFFLAHLLSKLFGLPADGFSILYQISIGLAAVFYCCLGLWYLRKLLMKLFGDEFISIIVPITIFFGTNLFYYTIYVGSFTHVYSFAFMSMAFYFAHGFFNESGKKINYVLLFSLCFLLVIFIRPFNALFLLAIPAFYKKDGLKFSVSKLNWKHISVIIISLLLIIYQFGILYQQTGSFFPYTYTGERFYFNRAPHIFEILFSYQSGWFLYVPLAFISIFSLVFLKKNRSFVFLFLLLAIVIYLYASWWYWAIFTRTIVDFTSVFAILLGLFLFGIRTKKAFKPVLVLMLVCVSYFQLKSYQFRNGILDNNYTYGEYYWRYFFTTRSVNIFPVHPKTIIKEQNDLNDFEKQGEFSNEMAHDGKQSLLLNSKNVFSNATKYKMPDFFSENGFKKIKTSFWIYFTGDISELHLVYKFYRNKDTELVYMPFYLKDNKINYNEWEYKEFGCDVPSNVMVSDSVQIFLWNPGAKEKVYIDNLNNQFLLTDSSMEMVK